MIDYVLTAAFALSLVFRRTPNITMLLAVILCCRVLPSPCGVGLGAGPLLVWGAVVNARESEGPMPPAGMVGRHR